MMRVIVCTFITSVLLILLAFPLLSNAHYQPGCGEAHSKLSIKTHAQQFVEDVSAPRSQRIKAMECLIFYGRRGVRILSRVLEPESDSHDLMGYALMALGRIQDRSVMEPMLRLLGYNSKGSQQSRADWNSTSSGKIKPSIKERAVGILADLAFSSLGEPNRPLAIRRTKTGGFWIETSVQGSKRYYYKGERLRRHEINRITEVLKKIAESEPEDTTEAEKQVVQAAAEELARIEKRMALLKKYGARDRTFSTVYLDTLDFHCPPTGGYRLTFCYRRGAGTILYPSFAQIEIKSSNNILPSSLPQFGEPPSNPRPFCRNPFHNP